MPMIQEKYNLCAVPFPVKSHSQGLQQIHTSFGHYNFNIVQYTSVALLPTFKNTEIVDKNCSFFMSFTHLKKGGGIFFLQSHRQDVTKPAGCPYATGDKSRSTSGKIYEFIR